MAATIRVEYDTAAMDAVDAQLARLEVLDRQPALTKALRKAATVSAKRLRQILPKPGYPGDKPGLKALNKTVKVRVKRYEKVTVSVMGYDHNGGQHGHNVDQGHAKVLWGKKTSERVEGKGYLAKAVADTREESSRTLESEMEIVVDKVLG